MLPELPLSAWEPTKQTLHLWAQIVGKVMLVSAVPRNHWWHAALHPGVRGLTTGRLDHDGRTFAIDVDFVEHALRVRTEQRTEEFPLEDGLSVASFDERLHGLLATLGLDVEIAESPFGVPLTTPFPEDTEHASYDRGAPAFYSYTSPEPAGIGDTPLASGAAWTAGPTGGLLAVLPYESVRLADDPAAALQEFLRSAYEAGATTSGWNRSELEA